LKRTDMVAPSRESARGKYHSRHKLERHSKQQIADNKVGNANLGLPNVQSSIRLAKPSFICLFALARIRQPEALRDGFLR
jgi:hypothetical protein